VVPGWLCARTYSGQKFLKFDAPPMAQRVAQGGFQTISSVFSLACRSKWNWQRAFPTHTYI
jgi:hypothetical protein